MILSDVSWFNQLLLLLFKIEWNWYSSKTWKEEEKKKSRGIEILKIIRNFRKEYALNDVPD